MTGAFLRREKFAHRHSEDGDRGCSYAATSQRAPGPTEAGRGKRGTFTGGARGAVTLPTP